eukprot:CAMPEP_0174706616 /NCGR_PEP_ID=MMETSP1094-20130205/9392_1 /TAXON_ID=156173 /ORGANISM="Chrysochromulina brevifilum, Strain UTEX LB 985" /LENGTH=485 /DNA_ID=CAMNT_0015904901 /DNA_START=129 /DNA_END=1583 /DNA_ORIENTATION=-
MKSKPATENAPLVGVSEPAAHLIPVLGTRSKALGISVTLGLLCFGVLMKHGASGLLGPTLPTLIELNYTGANSLAGVGSAGSGLGKISQIGMSYAFGPRFSCIFGAALAGTSVLLFTTANVPLFFMSWCIASFGNAHVWAPANGIIRNWVDAEAYGRSVGMLGCFQTCGTVVCGAAISAMLAAFPLDIYGLAHVFSFWWLIGGVLLLVAALQLVFLRSSAAEAGFPPPASLSIQDSFGQDSVASSAERGHVQAMTTATAGPANATTIAGGVKAQADDLGEVPVAFGKGTSLLEALQLLVCDLRVWLMILIFFFYTLGLETQISFSVSFLVSIGYGDSTANTLMVVSGALWSAAQLLMGHVVDTCGPAANRGLAAFYTSATLVPLGVLLVLYACDAPSDTLRVAAPIALIPYPLSSIKPYLFGASIFAIVLGGGHLTPAVLGAIETPAFFMSLPVTLAIGDTAAAGDYTLELAVIFGSALGGQLVW